WHFLYVAPLIFLVSLAIIVGVSLVTEPPSAQAVERYVWKKSFFSQESAELAALPWFKNYRVLSIALLILTAIFVYIWR
ncbi:MAG: sodium transporter, partial [Verrucomicrobiota bacterium]